jgi:D-alanyl-D-alanine carboxypeptidase
MRTLLLFVVLFTATAPVSLHAATPASKSEVARYAQQLLNDNYAADGPGAAVLVAHGDEILFRGARGMANIQARTPLTADDMFEIGSITKQFSAAGLLKLVEAGKVSLDDPLSKFVKDYPNGDKITVLELLNHTSGVKDYTEIPGRMDAPIRVDMTTAQLVDSFKHEKPEFAPGQEWRYDNSGYVLVGAVIEAASGLPWHVYLQQTLFTPLGLSHTHYGADPDVIARQAHGYTLSDGKPAAAAQISMTQPHAAGALVSTVDDLLKWNRALHEGKVLKSAMYQRMITPVGKAIPQHYGFGISHATLRGQDMLEHGGGIFGFRTDLLYLPDRQTTVVVLQNSDGDTLLKSDPERLAKMLGAFASGNAYPDARPIAVDAAVLKQAEGVYRIDDKNTRVLRIVDGKLTSLRTGGQRSDLIPIANDTFLYDGSFTFAKLERDGAGKITGMRFFPEGEGEGQVVARSAEPLPVEPSSITLPRAALERVTGDYSGGGMELKVFLDGEKLKAQMGPSPAIDLLARSSHTFFAAAVDATLEFSQGESAAQAVTLHQGTDVIEFKRKPLVRTTRYQKAP